MQRLLLLQDMYDAVVLPGGLEGANNLAAVSIYKLEQLITMELFTS